MCVNYSLGGALARLRSTLAGPESNTTSAQNAACELQRAALEDDGAQHAVNFRCR